MFLFVHVCDLLEQLFQIVKHDPPLLPRDATRRIDETVARWFNGHRGRIHSTDTDGIALLSALLPERRTDKVYSLQTASLEKVLKRILGLSRSRIDDLERWREPGCGDLADCVERVMKQAVRNLRAWYFCLLIHQKGDAGTGRIESSHHR
jgi:DNA ligase-4